MKTLMTSAEVAAMAFPGSLDPDGGFVAEASIIAAQQKFIRPVLGPLYGALESYPDFVESYVKPALAQWVRYMVLPAIAAQVGSSGIVAPRGQNFESVAPMSVAALRSRAKADARALTNLMAAHLMDNAARFPEYDHAQNILARVSTTGNVIL